MLLVTCADALRVLRTVDASGLRFTDPSDVLTAFRSRCGVEEGEDVGTVLVSRRQFQGAIRCANEKSELALSGSDCTSW